MGKIVVNKHFDVKANVTPESFVHKGEIIISNQVGYEGIFIVNKNGDMFFISPTNGGSGSGTVEEYRVRAIAREEITSALTDYVKLEDAITEQEVRTISAEEVAKIVSGASESFDTLKEISDWILSDTTGAVAMANDIKALKAISADTRLDTIESDYATKEYVKTAISLTPEGGSSIVLLSSTDYETLIAEGSVIVNDIEIVYNEFTYYAIYNPEE